MSKKNRLKEILLYYNISKSPMPKTQINYSKTVIYKLINYDYPDLIYVGSTTNFKNRKNQHKCACINPDHSRHCEKKYQMIRKNGGWENWKMIVICEFPCDNQRQADQEEDRYILEYKATLNTTRAFCSTERRKEQIILRAKVHKQKLLELGDIICDCGISCGRVGIRRHERTKLHLKRIEDKTNLNTTRAVCNIELKKEQAILHTTTYRKKLLELGDILCNCGVRCGRADIRRHERTKLHLQRMEEKNKQ
jgi:hypothetical protein